MEAQDRLRREAWGDALLPALGLALAYFPILFFGHVWFWGDLELQFEPWWEWSQRWLRQGIWPLWNPNNFWGEPFAASLQTALFYPPRWPMLFGEPFRSLSWFLLFHLWLTGWGMTRLLRATVAPQGWAARLGGWLWMLSGFMSTRVQFPSIIATVAWLPFLLQAVWRVRLRPGLAGALALSLVWGLMLLAGHIQMAFLCLGLALAWMALPPRPSLPAWGTLLGGLGGGTLLSAVQWLPTWEFLRLSTRQALSFEEATRFSVPPWHWLTFVAPLAFGSPRTGNYWGVGNYWETCGYLSLLPVLLLAEGRLWRDSWCRWAAWVAGLGLALATGSYGWLYRGLYEGIPGVRLFHAPSRFLLWVTLAGVVAIARGIFLLEGEAKVFRRLALRAQRWAWGLALLAGGAVFWGGGTEAGRRLFFTLSLFTELEMKVSWEVFAQAAALGMGLGLLLAGVAFLLYSVGFLWGRRQRWPLAPLAFVLAGGDGLLWASAFYPTAPASLLAPPRLEGIEEGALSGGRLYHPDKEVVRVWLQFLNPSRFGPATPERIRALQESLIPNLNLRLDLPCASGYNPLRLQKVEEHLKRLEALPEEEQERALARWGVALRFRLAKFGRLPWEGMVGEWVPVRQPWPRAFGVRGEGPPLAWEYRLLSPQRVLTIGSPLPGGRLRVLDTAYPGWRAWDVEEQRWLEVQPWEIFRQVEPRGGKVVWVFDSTPQRLGGFLTALALLGMGAWGGFCLGRKKLAKGALEEASDGRIR